MTHRRCRPTRARVAAGLLAVGLTTGVLGATGAAEAQAAPSTTRGFPLTQCFGLSPNVVDTPWMPRNVAVEQYDGYTTVLTTYSSVWLFIGYESVARLDWQQLSTGNRGTLFSTSRTSPPNTGVNGFNFPRHRAPKGKVRVTLSAVNRNALWAIPSNSCTGVIEIR